MDGYDKNGLTPFRAWCFKNWPYLISDDMTELELLYAILGKFKEVLEEWEQMKVDWGEFQTTINEAISQMKQEIAEFEAKINGQISDLEGEWNAFAESINSQISNLKTQWANFQNTITNTTIPNEVERVINLKLPSMVESEVSSQVPTEVENQLGTKIGTLTPNTAAQVDSTGKIVSSPISSTELNYLDGAKSNIQSQLDSISSEVDSIESGLPTGGPFAGSASAGGPAKSTAGTLTINVDGSPTTFNGSDNVSVSITQGGGGGGQDDRIGSLTPNTVSIVGSDGKITSSDVTPTQLQALKSGPFAGAKTNGGTANSANNLSPTYSDDTADDIDGLLATKISKIETQASGASGMYDIVGGWQGQNYGSTIGAFFSSTQAIDAYWFTGNRIWSRRRNGGTELEESLQYIPADKNGNITFNRVQWDDNDFMAEYIYNCLKNAGYLGLTPGGGTEDYPASGYTQLTQGETYWGTSASSPTITVDIQVQSKRESGVLYYMFKTYLEVQVKTQETYYGYPVYGSLTLNGASKVSDYLIVYQNNWRGGATWTTDWIAATNNKTGSNPVVITIDSGEYSGSGGRDAQNYSFTV